MLIKKINNFLEEKSMIIFSIFLLIQPIFDIFISLFNHYNYSPMLIFIIKILFLFFTIYYLFFIKKQNIKYLILIFLYSLIFILINYFSKPNGNIFFEIETLIKVVYFPIVLLFILNVIKEKKMSIKNLIIVVCMYLFLIIIPDVLNLGFDSYLYDKEGIIGLFYSANAVGNIISILMPIAVLYFFKNKKLIFLILFLIFYFYVLLMMGTKAPLLTAIILVFYYFILLIIKLFKNKKYVYLVSLFLLVIIIVFLLIKILPLTAFYKNLIIHARNMEVNSIKDLLTFKKFDDYIFSGRLSFLSNSIKVYNESSILQKLFGIGYVIDGQLLKTSEMDYFVILIHQGIIGFIVLYYNYFKILFLLFKKYFKRFKKNFNNYEISSFIIAIITSILNALLAGHCLDVPSVSVFIAAIIGISYKVLNINK